MSKSKLHGAEQGGLYLVGSERRAAEGIEDTGRLGTSNGDKGNTVGVLGSPGKYQDLELGEGFEGIDQYRLLYTKT